MPLSLVHGSVLQVLYRLNRPLHTIINFLRLPVEGLERLDDLLKPIFNLVST